MRSPVPVSRALFLAEFLFLVMLASPACRLEQRFETVDGGTTADGGAASDGGAALDGGATSDGGVGYDGGMDAGLRDQAEILGFRICSVHGCSSDTTPALAAPLEPGVRLVVELRNLSPRAIVGAEAGFAVRLASAPASSAGPPSASGMTAASEPQSFSDIAPNATATLSFPLDVSTGGATHSAAATAGAYVFELDLTLYVQRTPGGARSRLRLSRRPTARLDLGFFDGGLCGAALPAAQLIERSCDGDGGCPEAVAPTRTVHFDVHNGTSSDRYLVVDGNSCDAFSIYGGAGSRPLPRAAGAACPCGCPRVTPYPSRVVRLAPGATRRLEWDGRLLAERVDLYACCGTPGLSNPQRTGVALPAEPDRNYAVSIGVSRALPEGCTPTGSSGEYGCTGTATIGGEFVPVQLQCTSEASAMALFHLPPTGDLTVPVELRDDADGGAARSALGAGCFADGDCASGFCARENDVDTFGVCCEERCGATCWTCQAAGAVGACVPLPANTADHRYRDTGALSCAPYTCGAGQCRTSCSRAEHCDPTLGQVCANGVCADAKSLAAPCSADGECATGFCAGLAHDVDGYVVRDSGVCCERACDDPCASCKGEGSGVAGRCAPVARGTYAQGCEAYLCSGVETCSAYCETDADCVHPTASNGAEPTYKCVDLQCVPSGDGVLPGDGRIGSACFAQADCQEGARASCATDFPGGACVSDCETHTCPAGTRCQTIAIVPHGTAQVCLRACTSGADCRAEYQCLRAPGESEGVCFPRCVTAANCLSGQSCDAAGECVNAADGGR